jgi:hypothetical protein
MLYSVELPLPVRDSIGHIRRCAVLSCAVLCAAQVAALGGVVGQQPLGVLQCGGGSSRSSCWSHHLTIGYMWTLGWA